MMKYDVLIIGGGAAGLSAALSASAGGARTAVLEAAPRVGRKILASGNGRCNLANAGAPRYYGGAYLASRVLEKYPAERVLERLHRLGLVTAEEEGGRIYPGCGQAAAVLDVLRQGLARQGAEEICGAPVTRLEKTAQGFLAHTPQGVFAAPAAVAACGGMAGKNLGHDGTSYKLLTALGHSLNPPEPALAQLITEKNAVRGLSGLRLPARLTLCRGKTPLEAAQGEALFTDYGVSGVCAMQLSRRAGRELKAGRLPVLYVDFSPMLGLLPRIYDRVEAEDPFLRVPAVLAFLEERTHILPRSGLFAGLAPRLLAQRMEKMSLPEAARFLAALEAPVTGVRGFEYAQVTAGGIPGEEFSPDTLESLVCPGLFGAGEMLDVDGDCGGFNLQFAFASGIIAGEGAAAAALHP